MCLQFRKTSPKLKFRWQFRLKALSFFKNELFCSPLFMCFGGSPSKCKNNFRLTYFFPLLLQILFSIGSVKTSRPGQFWVKPVFSLILVTHLSNQCQVMCWRQEVNTCAICWIPEILGSDEQTVKSVHSKIANYLFEWTLVFFTGILWHQVLTCFNGTLYYCSISLISLYMSEFYLIVFQLGTKPVERMTANVGEIFFW